MKNKLLFFCLLSLFCTSFVQANTHHQGCEAAAIVAGASKVLINEENKSIKFIKLEEPLAISPDQMAAWLKSVLKANAKSDFRLLQKRADNFGYVHYRFRQTHNSYDVDNGTYYIHCQNGKIISANGEFYPTIQLDVNPMLTASEAIAIGKSQTHAHKWMWEDDTFPIPQLYIAATKTGYHLAYKTDIYAMEPLSRKWLMIDALSGTVVAEYNRIHTNSVDGEAHCKYHGVQTITVDSISPNEYRLLDDTRGGGVETYDLNEGTDYFSAVDFIDSDNIWDTTTNDDDAALDAHWSTGGMYDYMLNAHGWESYDGLGTVMLSYIHFGSGFFNAFWDGQRMTYGDGDDILGSALTSTEVVGHEIMHGVTENTAGLIYSDESGGLNESYSDCFGVILDYQLNPAAANYNIGDDFAYNGIGFRSMSNPNLFENPDTYDGLYWDYNEVHSRSGVQNFWFYLLTQGGSGTNDIGDDYLVNAIPMDDVAAILFRSLSTYLTPNTTYADARFYSIQAAEDLFGTCSPQVINVTNGWHAVGVGDIFGDAVVSGFYGSSTYYCEAPTMIQFTNTSHNASTFEWNFGNGTTSTDEDPTVTYTSPGSYTVSLITNGGGLLCNSMDTIVLVDYITVGNLGAPTNPSCNPITNNPVTDQGIFNFTFVDIDNSTSGSIDNYQDYSCTDIANIQEGVLYPFSVRTGFAENIRIWIDVDNDGLFNNTNELVYESMTENQEHAGSFLIPSTSFYDVPLRLRIKSDDSDFDISDPCSTVSEGQVEDYSVFISENMQAPATDFIADNNTVLPDGIINFTDLTQNLPDSWSWVFEGGVPATSTDQHPVVTYSTLGLYPVSLVATNSYGEATEIKTDYILVVNIANMCTTSFVNVQNGLFTDSGGESGNYSDDENCEFLIDPGCAIELVLEFTEFNTESGYDYLYIYDGSDNNAPLIGIYDGTNSPGTINATSGQLYLFFDSDGSVTRPGWTANWAAVIPSTAPVAGFNISNNNTPVNTAVSFSDLSTNNPSEWNWNFGNGNTSLEQNPTHAFSDPGTYAVSLIVGNCFANDTIIQILTVQQFPSLSIDTLSIEVTLECQSFLVEPVTITNTGAGDLVFNFAGVNSLVSTNNDTQILPSGNSQTYDIIINNNGLTDGTYNATIPIYSNDPSFADLEINVTVHIDNSDCIDFEYSVLEECTAAIQFSDLSTSTPSAWSWDFGDGSSPSTDANPTHNYTENGTYTVVLTTTNSFGPAEHELTVSIENLISAEIQSSSPAEINLPINFESTVSTGVPVTTYSWDFGDGNNSTEANPDHTYTGLGNYTVTLTVVNSAGCQATTTTEISILASGIAELESNISIYPNPTADDLYIKNTSSEIYNEIEVVNAIGQVVKRIDVGGLNAPVYSLDLEGLAAGVYIVGIHFEGEGVLRRKIVIE
ncbi:MAG: Zn-dependent metalloprotease/chitodextrinase [Flavobacteriales bacterium]|jgi:Zn-dependent metalloprotease/chitodextrinase